ncbi:MAG: M48 family metallopeptidase [Anaerolineae bacterium]|nr:M48 family metallopeptidase [Anaerolineae bacterium]
MKKKLLIEARAQKSSARTLEQPLEDLVPLSVFRAEVAAWAKRIGVTPKEIRLRPLKRKWASCSSRGCLTFDTALLKQPARVRAQVIVHELLHLKVPNHGKLFKALYKAYVPEAPNEIE